MLRGGPSAEREISLASGQAVAAALRQRGHAVYESDITPDDLSALDRPTDVVFPALHGTFGEDGQLQAILARRNLPFVGSDAAASALCMDKVAAKRRVSELGIDTPAFAVLAQPEAPAGLACPLVVKPANQGSSVDTFVLRAPGELVPAIRQVVGRFGQALVERFVAGDEFTVGFLGAQALPPICVRPRRGFYDYQAKYLADDTEYLFEAGHAPALLELLQRLSSRVFTGLGCRHLGRVDWIVDAAGRPWFLEVNTIPGFTGHSLVPKAAARIGIGFDELVERLVRMALEPT